MPQSKSGRARKLHVGLPLMICKRQNILTVSGVVVHRLTVQQHLCKFAKSHLSKPDTICKSKLILLK